MSLNDLNLALLSVSVLLIEEINVLTNKNHAALNLVIDVAIIHNGTTLFMLWAINLFHRDQYLIYSYIFM